MAENLNYLTAPRVAFLQPKLASNYFARFYCFHRRADSPLFQALVGVLREE